MEGSSPEECLGNRDAAELKGLSGGSVSESLFAGSNHVVLFGVIPLHT